MPVLNKYCRNLSLQRSLILTLDLVRSDYFMEGDFCPYPWLIIVAYSCDISGCFNIISAINTRSWDTGTDFPHASARIDHAWQTRIVAHGRIVNGWPGCAWCLLMGAGFVWTIHPRVTCACILILAVQCPSKSGVIVEWRVRRLCDRGTGSRCCGSSRGHHDIVMSMFT